MAKQLQQKSTDIHQYGNHHHHHPGCMGGVLHFFDFHQRFHIRKMLLDRRHSEGRNTAGIKDPELEPCASSADKEHESMDVEGDSQMEDRTNSTNEISAKAHSRADEETSKKQCSKRKTSPLPSRLMRTISIHHLECDDYLRKDGTAAVRETKKGKHHPHHSDSAIIGETLPLLLESPDESHYSKRCEVCGSTSDVSNSTGHNQHDEFSSQLLDKQTLLQERLNEAKEYAKDLKGDFAVKQAKNFLDALELFNANREIFLKIIQDPDFLSAKYLQDIQNSSTSSVLTKSGSFPVPVARLSGKNVRSSKKNQARKDTETFAKQEKNSQSGISPSIMDAESNEESELDFPNSHYRNLDRPSSPSEFSFGTNCELKSQRNDGVVQRRFKDIKQRIKDMIKENKKERWRISMDGILDKIPYGNKSPQNMREEPVIDRRYGWKSHRKNDLADKKSDAHHFRRSRSLTESLERYSYLLRSTSSRESQGNESERLKLVQEDGAMLVRNPSKTLMRIHSLPEFESYFTGKDVQSEQSKAISASGTPSMDLEETNYASDVSFSDDQKSIENIVYTEEGTELSNAVEVELENPEYSMEKISSLVGIPDKCIHQPVTDGNEENDESGDLPVEVIRQIPSNDQDVEPYLDPSQEDLISPAKFSVSEDRTELDNKCMNFKEQDSLVCPENHCSAHAPEVVERIIRENFDGIPCPDKPIVDPLHFQVDHKDEAEFNYVLDILQKSGLSDNEFLGRWYSAELPLDPSLFEEIEGSTCEVSSYEDEINLDHLLLFDLINEVLLEIYDASFALCPWLSCFDSRLRLVPAAYHVLEEVWANISWHLSCHPELNPTMDYVVGRDLARNTRWMNLRYETEDIGVVLEEMILDDILDKAIPEFLS